MVFAFLTATSSTNLLAHGFLGALSISSMLEPCGKTGRVSTLGPASEKASSSRDAYSPSCRTDSYSALEE